MRRRIKGFLIVISIAVIIVVGITTVLLHKMRSKPTQRGDYKVRGVHCATVIRVGSE